MKPILVTGGAGFIGSHLAIALREQGLAKRVIALDNLHRQGAELNLSRLEAAGVDFLRGDVRNAADLDAAGPISLLLECSAEPSVLAGQDGSPRYLIDTNLGGTVNCLELARSHDAALIFLSTSRVYPLAALRDLAYTETETRFELAETQAAPGASAEGVAEDFPLEGARSLYGATKRCSELLIEEYTGTYGLRAVVNRCGVVAGPWQMGRADQGVVTLWVARHVYGAPLSYIGYGGSGKQVRDLIHIADLTRLILHQVRHLDTFAGQTFNVGGGRAVSVSLLELTRLCEAATGNRIEIASELRERPADIPLYLTDRRRVTAAAGWRPECSVEGTVDDIHRWIRDHHEELAPILS